MSRMQVTDAAWILWFRQQFVWCDVVQDIKSYLSYLWLSLSYGGKEIPQM